MDRWFGGKWSVEIIYCPRALVSTLRGRFDYVTLHFCGLLLGFVGDCMITGCYVSPPLKYIHVCIHNNIICRHQLNAHPSEIL